MTAKMIKKSKTKKEGARVKAIEAVRDWILTSGIQVRDPADPTWGAFNAWYDLDLERPRYVYPEITGYGITTLLFLNDLKPDRHILELARIAGDWASQRAIVECGGVRPRDHYERSERDAMFYPDHEVVVTFDSGMMLASQTNLFEKTQSLSYLESAAKIADFIVDRAQNKNGTLKALFDVEKNRWVEKLDKWSIQPGPYHAKLAIGLLHMHHLTSKKRYLTSAERLCRATLKMQQASGRFITIPKTQTTNMHPHLYAAEGLIVAGVSLSNKTFLKSAANAVRWSLSQMLPDGGLPCEVSPKKKNTNVRSDTVAQCLRLASMLYALGELPAGQLPRLAKLEAKLLRHQWPDGKQAGGFLYGQEATGARRHHLNFWCSAFALQALDYYQEYVNDKRALRDGHFI